LKNCVPFSFVSKDAGSDPNLLCNSVISANVTLRCSRNPRSKFSDVERLRIPFPTNVHGNAVIFCVESVSDAILSLFPKPGTCLLSARQFKSEVINNWVALTSFLHPSVFTMIIDKGFTPMDHYRVNLFVYTMVQLDDKGFGVQGLYKQTESFQITLLHSYIFSKPSLLSQCLHNPHVVL